MKARIKSVSRVKVAWFYEDDIYLYESMPGSSLVNPTADVVRFELRDLYEEDDNFEVIISGKGDFYAFGTDYYGKGEDPRPLKRFDAQDETIFLPRGQQRTGLLSPSSLNERRVGLRYLAGDHDEKTGFHVIAVVNLPNSFLRVRRRACGEPTKPYGVTALPGAIDYLLPMMLREFREKLTEEVERELIEASKLIPEAIETYGPMVVNLFVREVQPSARS